MLKMVQLRHQLVYSFFCCSWALLFEQHFDGLDSDMELLKFPIFFLCEWSSRNQQNLWFLQNKFFIVDIFSTLLAQSQYLIVRNKVKMNFFMSEWLWRHMIMYMCTSFLVVSYQYIGRRIWHWKNTITFNRFNLRRLLISRIRFTFLEWRRFYLAAVNFLLGFSPIFKRLLTISIKTYHWVIRIGSALSLALTFFWAWLLGLIFLSNSGLFFMKSSC